MGEIVAAFDRLVADRGDDEALWSRGEGRRSSFSELAERSASWGRFFADADGSPIALATGNGTAFVELFLALLRLELPVVAVDGSLGAAEKRDLCRRLGVSTLLDRDPLGAGVSGASGPERTVADRSIPRCEPLADGVRRWRFAVEPTIPPPGTALVKLTSGSTGEPLGACFDEAALTTGIRQIGEGMALDAAERVLLAIPLSHSYGFDNGVLSLLVLGTPLVLAPSLYPRSLLRAAAESRATFLPVVPPLARGLGQTAWPDGLDGLRVICAGGVLTPESARRFLRVAGRPIHNFYGSTETGGISFEDAPHEAAACGTVGRPLPGVDVELDDDQRVWVDSAANLIGRFGEDRAAEKRRVLTGDHGERLADGRLRLTGRTADILNIGGRKVASACVEEALCHLPGVREAAVVGVEDAVRGERAVAFLVADRWPVDLGGLPAALTPRKVCRLDALPHTVRGKLDRARLRRQALADAQKGPRRPDR